MTDHARMGQFVKTYRPERYSVNRAVHSILTPSRRAFSARADAIVVQEKKFPDVSFYQGDISWDVMRTQTDAVIIRAGQNIWEDPQFRVNWAKAKMNGIKRGCYWFYDDRVDPGKQAALLVSLIRYDLPEMEVVCDWENTYSGAFGGLKNVVAFMQAVEAKLPSVKMCMYSGYYWWMDRTNPVTNAAQYGYLKDKPLWLAWYTTNAAIVKVPAPWGKLTFWQFGTPAVGHDYGVATAEIDMNYYNGTASEFAARYGGDVMPPPPSQEQPMKIGTLKTDLNIRNGFGTTGTSILLVARAGDKVVGTIDTARGWFVIDHLILSGKEVKTVVQSYCSAYAGYYSSIVDYVPPTEPAGLADEYWIGTTKENVQLYRKVA